MITVNETPVERVFELADGRRIAAQVWHKPGAKIFLALHGWLDNSATFARIAPLLNATVVALDLAGHGYSYHRPVSSPYHLWDDLLDVEDVIDQLGVANVGLLGHSRGAIISAMFAAALPERVSQIFLIDGLLPEPVAGEQAPEQLRKAMLEYKRHASRQFPVYKDFDAAVSVRLQGMFPLSEEAARIMVARGSKQVEGGVTWRVDPKLLAPSMIKLTQTQSAAFISAIKVPATLVMGSQGMPLLFPTFVKRMEQFAHIEQIILNGSHHLHLESQAPQVATVFNERVQPTEGQSYRV